MVGEKIPNNSSTNWDILSSESDAVWGAKQAREIQKDFGNRLKSLEESGSKMSEKEFEMWEDDYGNEYNSASEKLEEEGVRFDKYCDSMVNAVAYLGNNREKELKYTVEAYAGNFYHERKNALKNAIENSSESEEKKQQDKEAMDDFVSAVLEHIDFKYATKEEEIEYGLDRFDNDRTRAHNNAIKKLNHINDLAREYGTKPFTVRNFNPSDLIDKNRQTESEIAIFLYDRHIVEEYYALAFSDKMSRAEAQMKNREKYGLY